MPWLGERLMELGTTGDEGKEVGMERMQWESERARE